MFREMRRIKNKTDVSEAMEFLKQADDCIISMISVDNDYPYSTAVNHAVVDGMIYFHSAKSGHKIDNIIANNKISLFATADSYIDKKKYTTFFKSVHVFGKAYIVEDKNEFKKALYEISRRFTGKFFAKAGAEIASAVNKTMVVRIEIDHIAGKKTKNYQE